MKTYPDNLSIFFEIYSFLYNLFNQIYLSYISAALNLLLLMVLFLTLTVLMKYIGKCIFRDGVIFRNYNELSYNLDRLTVSVRKGKTVI